MTRDEVLSMPAGSEMDALIAEKVMGMELARPLGEHFVSHDMAIDAGDMMLEGQSMGVEWEYMQPPPFSSDISAAWKVVEKMRELYDVVIDLDSDLVSCKLLNYVESGDYRTLVVEQIYKSAPLAICRAALLAVSECH